MGNDDSGRPLNANDKLPVFKWHGKTLDVKVHQDGDGKHFLRFALPNGPASDDENGDAPRIPDMRIPELPRDGSTGSDLDRLWALTDEDIDYSDAPVPDLADWVKNAQPFDPNPPSDS